MKKTVNRSHIEGYVYSHKLEKKVTGETSKNPGQEYIKGTLSIATDKECMNVFTVEYIYVTPLTKDHKTNTTYTILDRIINGTVKNVMESGIENAGVVAADCSLNLNEWVNDENEIVSAKRNSGGFLKMITEANLNEKPELRATFEADMIITSCKYIDETDDTEAKMSLHGCIFTFRNELLPFDFSVYNKDGIAYFENAEISNKNPMFVSISGQQISQSIVKRVETETAWGPTRVKEYTNSRKDFVVTDCSNPYDWDDEKTILAAEFAEIIANRELHLAELKKSRQEYLATKAATPSPMATPKASTDAYNF